MTEKHKITPVKPDALSRAAMVGWRLSLAVAAKVMVLAVKSQNYLTRVMKRGRGM